MFQTLAYYATVFHRGFTAYTTQRLQALVQNAAAANAAGKV